MAKDIALLASLDRAAEALLKKVNGASVTATDGQELPPEAVEANESGVSIQEQVAIFNGIVRYLAIRNRVDPPEDEESGLDALRSKLRGGKAVRKTSRDAPAPVSVSVNPDGSDDGTDKPPNLLPAAPTSAILNFNREN